LRSFEIRETPEPASPFGIQNTLPGSPEIADTNSDGYGDAVYFGDLKGRLWKTALSSDTGDWDPEAIYHDPYMHPIITKPAVSISQTDQTATIYFGTGGDEAAPGTASYSFIALVDGAAAEVEWFIGPDDLADQLGIGLERKKAEFAQGERVWADPVISDRVVYIATLEGSIESLNPCTTLSGEGRIYGRNTMGSQVGGTALLTGAGAPVGFLETKQKVRSAVTIGETQTVTEEGQSGISKRKVFIQSYTQPSGGTNEEPPSQVLAQPVPATQMVIRSWREVYKVFKR
jgi:Tfp pilus tip-associated adhesin PilY1